MCTRLVSCLRPTVILKISLLNQRSQKCFGVTPALQRIIDIFSLFFGQKVTLLEHIWDFPFPMQAHENDYFSTF